MTTFYTDKMIQIIKDEYPDSDNDILSKKLGISESALKTKASRLGIKKSKKYKVKFNRSMKIKTRGKIPGFCFSLLTLIIVILFEVLGLIADHQLSFNNCQTISSTVINDILYLYIILNQNGCWALRDTSSLWISSPYNF